MLRERISELIEKRDALLVIYTPEWPEVKKLEAQIKPIEDELAKAPTEIVSSMRRRYEAAATKEQSLRRAYEQQKGTTTQQTRDQIDLIALTQELETNKQYLNTLLQRQRELNVAQGAPPNEVVIANSQSSSENTDWAGTTAKHYHRSALVVGGRHRPGVPARLP